MLSTLGLFDTLVPISSIVTVSVVVGFTLPRRENFGLFLLVWWAVAVLLSLNHETFFFESRTQWLPSSRKDAFGMFLMLGYPATMLLIMHRWFQNGPLQGFVLKDVPLWGLLALHIYRLDGLSIVAPFWRGDVPKFVGFQTILLDVIIGAVALPLTIICYQYRGNLGLLFAKYPWVKGVIFFWNSLGLYDLCSAYLVLVLNYCHIGGQYITEPPLSKLGTHPFPLLILFQVPIAIAIHVLLLTRIDDLTERQSDTLPFYLRRLRDRG